MVDVFPTHVGVDRSSRGCLPISRRVPHARGGGPNASSGSRTCPSCSPRTWGWTAMNHELLSLFEVFPTHVGVDRLARMLNSVSTSVPHARGGGPRLEHALLVRVACSPRTWGWTAH